MTTLDQHFAEADSLLDLSRRLGACCLDSFELAKIALTGQARKEANMDRLAGLIGSIDVTAWQKPHSTRGFVALLGQEALELATRLSSQHPLDCVAALRGLCDGALTDFYTRVETTIELKYGMPLPFAVRPVNDAYGRTTTPFQETLGDHELLLPGTGYDLFPGIARQAGDLSVVLDFSVRNRLDELAWTANGRLPLIATLHPQMGSGHLDFSTSPESSPMRFFDVQPKPPAVQAMLNQLKALKSKHKVEVAVLPELCLPCPDALEAELAKAPEDYPPLVIAGSAHVRRHDGLREVRANESQAYMDGQRVLVRQKVRPFVAKHLHGKPLPAPLTEDITTEPQQIKILAGTHTRLAVVICSDLNAKVVGRVLEDAGVNLLFVPSFTYHPGVFNGDVCSLASRCQGVSVVVNADLDPVSLNGKPPERPFHVMVGVPREHANEQSHEYTCPVPQPFCGLFDPNTELASAMRWV